MESAEKWRLMIQLQVGIIIDQVVLCNMLGNGLQAITNEKGGCIIMDESLNS